MASAPRAIPGRRSSLRWTNGTPKLLEAVNPPARRLGRGHVAGIAAIILTLACATRHEVAIEVTEAGYVPAVTEVPAHRAVRLVFTRRVRETCATDVVFPVLHRGFDLPLGEPVRVELPASAVHDTVRFSCSTQATGGMLIAR